MTSFMFFFSIVSLLLSAAAQVVTWVLYRKTKAERVFYFILSNLLTFFIVSVLAWDLFFSILGRDTALRSFLWLVIDFCVCGLCATLPRVTHPRKPSRLVRWIERATGASAAVLAALRIVSMLWPRSQREPLLLYAALYGVFSLALIYFGVGALANRKSFLSDATLRHFQRALDITGISILVLFPALVFVDFVGWLVPAFSRRVNRGFSVLPLFLDIMSVSIAYASILDVLEPIPVAGVDSVDDGFIHKYALSPREAQVVPLVLRNLSYREIAEALFIAPGTVRTHVIHIYQKTNVQTRLELCRLVWSECRGEPLKTLQN